MASKDYNFNNPLFTINQTDTTSESERVDTIKLTEQKNTSKSQHSVENENLSLRVLAFVGCAQ